VVVVVVVAALVRVLCLFTLPLLISNDGHGYLAWGRSIVHGQAVTWPLYRTPGYPIFLAGVFAAFGVGPWGVLIVQHLLGVASAWLVALGGGRLGGRWAALVGGLAAALDPRLLGLESYAQTETLSVFLFVLAIALALPWGRWGWARAVALGLVLGCLCLVRPAFQAAAPFIAAGFVLMPGMGAWPRRALLAAVIAAAAALPVTPWLLANRARGVPGLAGGTSTFFWLGAHFAGVIDPDYPLPLEIREPYDRLVRGDPTDETHLHEFLGEVGAWSRPATERTLREWTLASVRSRPWTYARGVWYAALWQLDFYPGGSPMTDSETSWMIWRLSRDGRQMGFTEANFQFDGAPGGLEEFGMGPPRWPLSQVMRWWGKRAQPGLITLPFLLATIWGGVRCVRRREIGVALLIAGTGAYFAAHAGLLLFNSRFSMPAWAAWYMLAGAAAPGIAVVAARMRRAPDQAALTPQPAQSGIPQRKQPPIV
jgi:4-amino-4-deoxy-L-arabinose transferase-like glycosyltransferase